jgi:hypothetical protein
MARRKLHRVGLAVGIPLGFIAVVFAIGFVTDLAVIGSIKADGEEALEYLTALRKADEDNAWTCYSEAIEILSGRVVPDSLNEYLWGEVAFNSKLADGLRANADIIELVDRGADCSICTLPIKYEKGFDAEIPEYIVFEHISKLHTAKALRALESGKTDEGLEGLLVGIRSGARFASGSPTMLTHMIGLVCVRIRLSLLEASVAGGLFGVDQLEAISRVPGDLEQTLPPLVWNIEADRRMLSITLARVPWHNDFSEHLYPRHRVILRSLPTRLMFWRYLFSPRLAMLKALRSWDRVLADMNSLAGSNEAYYAYDHRLAREFTSDRVLSYDQYNPIFSMTTMGFQSMAGRKSETLARARLIGCAALVWKFRHGHGGFPSSLDLIDSELTEDPFTEGLWDYVSKDGEVVIRSPGLNLNLGDHDDLSITLGKRTIREYLSAKL